MTKDRSDQAETTNIPRASGSTVRGRSPTSGSESPLHPAQQIVNRATAEALFGPDMLEPSYCQNNFGKQ